MSERVPVRLLDHNAVIPVYRIEVCHDVSSVMDRRLYDNNVVRLQRSLRLVPAIVVAAVAIYVSADIGMPWRDYHPPLAGKARFMIPAINTSVLAGLLFLAIVAIRFLLLGRTASFRLYPGRAVVLFDNAMGHSVLRISPKNFDGAEAIHWTSEDSFADTWIVRASVKGGRSVEVTQLDDTPGEAQRIAALINRELGFGTAT